LISSSYAVSLALVHEFYEHLGSAWVGHDLSSDFVAGYIAGSRAYQWDEIKLYNEIPKDLVDLHLGSRSVAPVSRQDFRAMLRDAGIISIRDATTERLRRLRINLSEKRATSRRR